MLSGFYLLLASASPFSLPFSNTNTGVRFFTRCRICVYGTSGDMRTLYFRFTLYSPVRVDFNVVLGLDNSTELNKILVQSYRPTLTVGLGSILKRLYNGILTLFYQYLKEVSDPSLGSFGGILGVLAFSLSNRLSAKQDARGVIGNVTRGSRLLCSSVWHGRAGFWLVEAFLRVVIPDSFT